MNYFDDLQKNTPPTETVAFWRKRLIEHEIYQSLDTQAKIAIFMTHHIFAVWDFMSLLKRLQMDLTCVRIPWRPRLSAEETKYARFINEIVVGEETDEDGRGGAISHFDLYLQAMDECGADVSKIQEFLVRLDDHNGDAFQVLNEMPLPEMIKNFVSQTLQTAINGKTHEVCAAFFYGREDIIPEMFGVIVDDFERRGAQPERLLYYMKRHIELDGNEHGPLAAELLEFLCGNDEEKKRETERAAVAALKARIAFWDGVLSAVSANNLYKTVER